MSKHDEDFNNKLMDEILPIIRETGGYIWDVEAFINTHLPWADEEIKSQFRSRVEEINQRAKEKRDNGAQE